MNLKAMLLASVALAAPLALATTAARTTIVTFDEGAEGWNGNATVEPDGGNPGANAHFLVEAFGIELRNDSNPAFIGDLSGEDAVSVGLDIKVDSILFNGSEVSRNLVVEFRSHVLAADGYPYASVWTPLGEIQAAPGWATYAVEFAPAAADLPAGWGGYGAEDPVTYEPVLPPGVTFADVMANVDELAFTTFEPGFMYGFTDFDVRMDNLRITRGTGVDEVIFVDGFEAPINRAR